MANKAIFRRFEGIKFLAILLLIFAKIRENRANRPYKNCKDILLKTWCNGSLRRQNKVINNYKKLYSWCWLGGGTPVLQAGAAVRPLKNFSEFFFLIFYFFYFSFKFICCVYFLMCFIACFLTPIPYILAIFSYFVYISLFCC